MGVVERFARVLWGEIASAIFRDSVLFRRKRDCKSVQDAENKLRKALKLKKTTPDFKSLVSTSFTTRARRPWRLPFATERKG